MNKSFHTLIIYICLTLCVLSCATTGSVKPTTPLPAGKIEAHTEAFVQVSIQDPSTTNASRYIQILRDECIKRLRHGSFLNISTDETTPLKLYIVITEIDGSSAVMQTLGNPSDAEVKVKVTVKEGQSVLGELWVTGNSSTKSSVKIGGVNAKALSDQTPKALTRAAEYLVQYLKDNR